MSHMNEPCRTYEYVMPHIGMKYVVSHVIWYVSHTSDNALMCVTHLTNLSRVLPWGENEITNKNFPANSNLYQVPLDLYSTSLFSTAPPGRSTNLIQVGRAAAEGL